MLLGGLVIVFGQAVECGQKARGSKGGAGDADSLKYFCDGTGGWH